MSRALATPSFRCYRHQMMRGLDSGESNGPAVIINFLARHAIRATQMGVCRDR